MTEDVLQYRFLRNDLHATETAARGCLRLLSGSKKGSEKPARQKLVVGDQSGVTTVFGVGKHREVKIEFTTVRMPKPVTAIDVYCDQIFVATGARINAYNKKGKPFFGLETNLSDDIRQLRIDTPFLFTAGEYVLSHFRESDEKGFYLCPDRIAAAALARAPEEEQFDVFLGCQDRAVRTVHNTTKTAEQGMDSAVGALLLLTTAGGVGVGAARRELLYGTASGAVGCFAVSPANDLTRTYAVAAPTRRLGAIVAIAAGDVLGEGTNAIVLGRDDGGVEVHSLAMNADGRPAAAWHGHIGESVNAVECGCVTNTALAEVVVSSFSGKVLSFISSEDGTASAHVPVVGAALAGPQAPLPEAKAAPVAPSAAVAAKNKAAAAQDSEFAPLVEVLRQKTVETTAEINRLKELLKVRKTEFARATNAPASAGGVVSEASLRAVASEFKLRTTFVLDDAAALVLRIEADTAIDTVALQSNVELDFMDAPGSGGGDDIVAGAPGSAAAAAASAASEAAASNIVLSISKPPATAKETRVLAVARCSDPNAARAVSLRMRSVEGQYGTLRAFVTAAVVPRTAQLRTYTIRPLSLHQRVADSDVDVATLPLSSLKIQGSFSAKDAHAWVFQCLPDVPEVFSGEEGRLCFKSTFLHTVLVARYKRGEAEFLSENLSSLAILKECVTKEATTRKIQVRMASEAHAGSLTRMLALADPLLARVSLVARQLRLLEALRELESQEQGAQFLSPEHREILENSRDIEKETASAPRRLEYLKGLLVRLLFDRAVFVGGQSVPPQAPHQLRALLDRYEPKSLHDFFHS